jgi:hypothetical protein
MNNPAQISMTGLVSSELSYIKTGGPRGSYVEFRIEPGYVHSDKAWEYLSVDQMQSFKIKVNGHLATNLNRSLKVGDTVFVGGDFIGERWESVDYLTGKIKLLVVEAFKVARLLDKYEEVAVQQPNPKSDWQPFFQDFYFGAKKQPLNPQEETKNDN